MPHVTAPFINEQQHLNVNIDKKLMFAIWVLAKSESFLAVGDRFNLAKSTGHEIFKSAISAWAQLMFQYVQWPNAAHQLSSNICRCICSIFLFELTKTMIVCHYYFKILDI